MSSSAQVKSHQIGILLADDSKFMLEAIRELLQTEPRISILGEPTNFVELVKMAGNLQPQVAVVDVHMPGKDAGELKRLLTGCSVIAISVWDDEATRMLAEAIGAVQFFSKAALSTELIPAILHLGASAHP